MTQSNDSNEGPDPALYHLLYRTPDLPTLLDKWGSFLKRFAGSISMLIIPIYTFVKYLRVDLNQTFLPQIAQQKPKKFIEYKPHLVPFCLRLVSHSTCPVFCWEGKKIYTRYTPNKPQTLTTSKTLLNLHNYIELSSHLKLNMEKSAWLIVDGRKWIIFSVRSLILTDYHNSYLAGLSAPLATHSVVHIRLVTIDLD